MIRNVPTLLVLAILLAPAGADHFSGQAATASTTVSTATHNAFELPIFTGSQARELLGRRDAVRYGASHHDPVAVYSFVVSEITRRLPYGLTYLASDIARELIQATNRQVFDPLFVLALIIQESSVNPWAIGRDGELGLMQIRPTTARWILQHPPHKDRKIHLATTADLFRPIENIEIGIRYLSYLRRRFNGEHQRYLLAYNRGPSRAHSDSRTYVRRITKQYRHLLRKLDETQPYFLVPPLVRTIAGQFFL